MLWYLLGGLAILVAALLAFVAWRWTSVARGARKRDERIMILLDPLGEKLAAGGHPTAQEVAELASNPVTRRFLYLLLSEFAAENRFPPEFATETAQAEADLVYWLMHPNELQEAPRETLLVESLGRRIDGRECRFHVFRFQMPAGHWAGGDWLLGLAGPYFDDEPPFSGVAGAFSRMDKCGAATPGELVDWFIGMVQTKGASET